MVRKLLNLFLRPVFTMRQPALSASYMSPIPNTVVSEANLSDVPTKLTNVRLR